jgi:hypothetical protein
MSSMRRSLLRCIASVLEAPRNGGILDLEPISVDLLLGGARPIVARPTPVGSATLL